MNLSISNIGWIKEYDTDVYGWMKQFGYTGLEIAPTRIFPDKPYDKIQEAAAWSNRLKKEYGFSIPSMQSIWYGRQESLFGSREEREILAGYTRKAIIFAAAIGCKNLVFGCPRNRNLPEHADMEIGVRFFQEMGDYAYAHGTVIGMEANPLIYHTNYINDTASALELIRQVDSKGFLLNLDVGTMIQNNENISELTGNIPLIHHVHISEPELRQIEKRKLHRELKKILVREEYNGFVSIEMGNVKHISLIEEKLKYISQVFNAS